MCRLRVAPRDEEPQAAKFAGGHRIRVTPVPIPNTEVKPDTADGTIWETVWESRSLPALFRRARREESRRAFLCTSPRSCDRAIQADADVPCSVGKLLHDARLKAPENREQAVDP